MHMNIQEYLILYYIHSTPLTYFGHTCGHPREGALQRIYIVLQQLFEPMYRYKTLTFQIYGL